MEKIIFKEFSFIIFFLVVERVVSIDEFYEACRVPTSCGLGPNISYPFWIGGRQNASCGNPGFDLSCRNREPILKMSNDEYIIRDIWYRNQSFFVSKVGSNDICSLHTYQLSFTRFGPFSYYLPSVNLSLLFNCNTSSLSDEYSQYSLNCTSGNPSHRTLALFSDDPGLPDVNQSGQCNSSVVIPIDEIGNGSLGNLMPRDSVDEFLRTGFHLKWTATRCDECEDSGGRCGFNITAYKFMCFCTDRPQHRWCNGGSEINKGRKAAIGIGAGLGGAALVAFVIFIIYRQKKSKFTKSSGLKEFNISLEEDIHNCNKL